MSRVVPLVIAVLAIGALTVVEGRLTERWGDNRHCAYAATLLDQVPPTIGEWEGEDNEVELLVQEAAGARGYVSRMYKNDRTGKKVGVWFIVGHARDTARHTPNICYKAGGFETERPQQKVTLEREDGVPTEFWTAEFVRSTPLGEQRERVFWTWFKPKLGSEEPVAWLAPDDQRYGFGAAPALYKLYFTTYGEDAAAQEDSVCLEFAKEFLPIVEPIVAEANGAIPADFVPAASDAG